MLLSNARSNNQGFTLVETLTVIIFIGILSAIAAPSLLGMLNRNKVTSALDEVQGALREAQREAMRKGQQCTVTLNSTTGKVTGPCLVTGDRTLPSGVILATNLTSATVLSSTVTFSFRGNTNDSIKIVLYSNDSNQQKNCLLISDGLGIMRTGKYSGSITPVTSPTTDDCTTP